MKKYFNLALIFYVTNLNMNIQLNINLFQSIIIYLVILAGPQHY